MTVSKRKRTSGESQNLDLLIGKSDTREYRFLNLPNGIEAILVKIPEGQSSKAAVSVAVNAGSMFEPDEFGGLAHFVEHCVFLGNKKYPNRNSLDKLLSKYNGYSNAHTELEYTAYYLEVNREGLTKAVDIFAAAFDDPLFDIELSCSELEAVDSEFHEVLSNDDCRIEHMMCHLADPNHPYKKFTWGNKKSLLDPHGKEGLVKAAREFFEQNYLASKMKLSIVSSYSFEKMEKLAQAFSSIGRDIGSASSKNPLITCKFPISNLPLLLAIKPVTEIHQLILLFQLPPIASTYRDKPADYLSHLIGHEGEGSLIHILRTSNLAVDITAGVGSEGYANNSGLSLFEIKLNLTSAGVSQYNTIINEYIFPYIEKLASKGISETTYMEMKKIGSFQFNYTSEDASKEPIDIAEELSTSLLETMQISKSDILIVDYMYEKFDKNLICKFLSFISRDMCITMIVSDSLGLEWEETEPVFGIQFSRLNVAPLAKFPPQNGFIIPPKVNEFVPGNITNKEPSPTSIHETNALFVSPHNVKISEKISLYMLTETRSKPTPKMDIRMRFNTPRGDVESFVSNQVWVGYVTDLLEAKLYTAKLVGYKVSIASVTPTRGHMESTGIEIVVNGYYEKIWSVVQMIVDEFKFGDRPFVGGDEGRLGRVIEQIGRNFKNEEIHPVTSQAINIRRSVIAPASFYRSHEKFAVLKSIEGYSFECESVEVLVVGGEREEVESRVRNMLSTIPFVDSPVIGNPLECGIVKAIESEICLEESTINVTEPTSAVIVYYQFSPEFSVEMAATADVISDLMSEPFFDSLRTEEQLGYSVQCGSRFTNGSIGFEFMIQSSCESTDELVKRIEKYIQKFFDKEIAPMDKDEYEDQIQALIEGLVEPPTCLAAEAKDLWSEISEGRYMWNYNALVKAEIEGSFLHGGKNIIKNIIQKLFIQQKRIIVKVNSSISK